MTKKSNAAPKGAVPRTTTKAKAAAVGRARSRAQATPDTATAAAPTRRRAARKAPAAVAHPHSVAMLATEPDTASAPDQPFAEGGPRDAIDPDLRQRMISERAYRLFCERGSVEGYDVEDWLQAEAEVDHLLLNPQPG